MATNHKPVIKGNDHGIWRRIRLIPFTTTIAPEKQDKQLQEKLKAEASGILNWLIEGAMRWSRERLKTPAEIAEATNEYRGEMDVLGSFIKEQCLQIPGVQIKARELFRAYQEWCEENNEHASCERILGMRMKELHIEQKRLADGRYWVGLCLRASE
jgi:putative DNA primase/helicase